jgi:hypothetical protein
MVLDHTTSLGRISVAASSGIAFYNGGISARVETMRIDSAGNVGVGTATPNTGFGRSFVLYNAQNTGTVASNAYSLVQSVNRNSVVELSGSATSDCFVNFSTTPGTALVGVGANITAQALVIRTGGTTERMRIDSSGNVGIGTSSPARRFDVVTSSSDVARFFGLNRTIDGTGNVQVFTSNPQAVDLGGTLSLGGANGTAGVFDPWSFATLKGAKENSTSTNFSGYFAIGTATAGGTILERMRIDSLGDVGIGTSSPNFPVDVVANTNAAAVSIRGRSSDNLSFYQFTDNSTGNTQYGYILGGPSEMRFAQNGANYITSWTNGAERMRITSNGNVGIGTTVGTTTVSSGLAINNATAGNYPGLEIQTAGVTRLFFNANNAESYVSSPSNPLVFVTSSTERMRISSAGLVSLSNGLGIANQTWTTAGRPSSPVAGQQGYNTNFGQTEYWNGVAWVQMSIVTNPSSTYTASYLIVAGGGGGGAGRGGGGGAGGLLTSSLSLIVGNVYQVTVGAGGAGGVINGGRGATGTDSTALGLTAYGGGGGGGDSQSESSGTGGGSSGGQPNAYNQAIGSGYLTQGTNGGWAYGGGPAYAASGGGGSYSGGYWVSSGGGTGTAGAGGGSGTASSITGSSVTYAGGGAGGTYTASVTTTMGIGGAGGGGNGGYGTGGAGSGVAGTNGGTNLGGGGGGSSNGSGFVYAGGAGGSGVVILRVPTANYTGTVTGSPTVTTDGSFKVIKFTASGSYTA